VATTGAGAAGGAEGANWVRERGYGAVFWVGVLGPLLIRSDGAEVVVPAPKQRMILAALALRAGQVVSYDELAEIIWDGAPPSGARVAIRNYVKRLRQIMGPVAGRRIVTRDPGYALEAAPAEVDALRFTTLCAAGGEAIRGGDPDRTSQAWDLLTEALGLWRGNPLVDVPSNMLITAEVPRLDALRMQAQEWRMDAGLAQGRHSELVGELTQLARDHPWRERFHAQLMLALYRCGRQAEALEAYQRTRRLLVDELGVEPGRELRDLQAGILAADPRLTTPGSWTPGYLGPEVPAAGSPGAGRAGPGQRPARHPGPAAVRPVAARGTARVPSAPVPSGGGRGGSGPGGTGPGSRSAAGGPEDGQAAVVPRQLPAGVAHFAGRAAELAELRAWLTEATSAEESVKVLVIGGTAGAGKTALAVHWAHQSASEFPDGQLYVNLRGFDPSGTPVPAGDALRWFLGAFGVTEEQIPDSIEAQEALYRSVLAGKRVLVILDNARDAAQVRPLLPGSPTCLALVTSRARLPGLAATEGARLVPLDVLTAPEASELLASRLGERARAEPEAVRQLTEACSRLPLALSIVAARAAARPLLPLAGLARELTDVAGVLDALDAGDPVASVRGVFSWSCRQLSGPADRLFRLLGLQAGPDVSIPAAASLAGLGPAEAATAVAELADANLIAEHPPGRFAFHDLLRAYAADLAGTMDSEPDRRRAVYRVLDHYLHTAHSGSLVLNPARDFVTLDPPLPGVTAEPLGSASDARAWFEAERQVLLAAISQAADLGFDRHAWQLPWAVWLFFDREGSWHDQVSIQNTAILAAQRLGDRAAQGNAYRDLGATYGRLGLPAEAREYCTQALELHRAVGDRLGEARAHLEITMLAEQQGRLAEALGHAKLSLALFRDAGHRPGLARMLNAVGYLHAQLGDYEQALENCQQALDMYRSLGDPLNAAATWDSVGYVLLNLGRYDEAISCLHTALGLVEGLQPGYHKTTWLVHLGDAYHAAGEPGQARLAWQEALDILEDLKHADAPQVQARLDGVAPPTPGSVPAATSPIDGPLHEDHAVGA